MMCLHRLADIQLVFIEVKHATHPRRSQDDVGTAESFVPVVVNFTTRRRRQLRI